MCRRDDYPPFENEKITIEEQKEVEELIRDEIAVRVRQFGDNEYLAADEIIRYLDSIGYESEYKHSPTGTYEECEAIMRQLTNGERGCANPGEHKEKSRMINNPSYEPGSIEEKLNSLERAIRHIGYHDNESYIYILSLIHEILTAIVADYSIIDDEEPEVPSGGPD